MPVLSIVDPDDPRLADYRAIRDPALVRQRGRFVAEGRRVVRTLLAGGRFEPHSLLVTPAALADLAAAVAARPDLPVFVAEPAVLAAAGGFPFHRGCLGIGHRRAAAPLQAGDLDAARLVVVLEALAQADNVGAVFRNAAAFGADLVVLDPRCCDPLYRKAVRTSMGAALVVPFVRAEAWPGDLETLRAAGFRLVALTPAGEATPIGSLPPRTPADRVALLVGGEGDGLSAAALSAADLRVRIPMAAGIDSLNVATATGIALHRLSAGAGAPADAR